jgi:methylthioribose-1-phosphate isomerase
VKVGKKHYRSIWTEPHQKGLVKIIDQRMLPHSFEIAEISSLDQMLMAINSMSVRGAGLIGAAAAYGMYLASMELKNLDMKDDGIGLAAEKLKSTRPTALNLSWAINKMQKALELPFESMEALQDRALILAEQIATEDAEMCRSIGGYGVPLIQAIGHLKRGAPVNILTHCNAGWLAFVDYGTALSPVYEAHKMGIDVHIWVDETRPRNQGASLTAWELNEQDVAHTIIADNTGGHLMQHGMVDIVLVGADRCSRRGGVANKIGTYLKALAAFDNQIPFYVALPSSTIDWQICNGINDIPIETRSEEEIKYISGKDKNGNINKVLLCPEDSLALNYGFDVTPARLISGLITERGICKATEHGLLELFPEQKRYG